MKSPDLARLARLALTALLLLFAAGTARAQAVPAEPLLRIEAGTHTGTILRVGTDAAGRFAVTVSDDKSARVWDIASGQMLRVLRPPIGPGEEGTLQAVALSPDGSTVAASGRTKLGSASGYTLYLFDRVTGQMQRRLTGLPNSVHHLAFSPDGAWLAIALSGRSGLRVWDWRGQTQFSDPAYGSAAFYADWSRDGRLATSSDDGRLRLYRVGSALTKLVEAAAPGGPHPFGLAFHPDGRQIALGYGDRLRIDVLDADRLTLLFSANMQGVTSSGLAKVAWSPDGRVLAGAGMRGVYLWPNGGRDVAQETPYDGRTVQHFLALPAGGWLLGSAGAMWGVLSADKRWQPRVTVPIADMRNLLGDAFRVAAGGRRVQFGFEPHGQPPHVFDLARRMLQAGALDGGTPADITALPVRNWENSGEVALNGKALSLEQNERARCLAVLPGGSGFVLGADYSLRLFNADGTPRWHQPVPNVAWGVNIAQDGANRGRLIVAGYGDGTIRWHRASDGQELLALFPHADRKRWVLWTPTGYYDASPGAEELIGWQVNRGADQAADFFPASRFRARFYRPDVIDRVLDTLDESEALKQADLVANRRQETAPSVAQVLPPVVELLSGPELTATTPQLTLRVRGRSAADAPVTAWRVRINGQLAADARGLGRQDVPASGGEKEIVVAIPPQDSALQVFAENRHGTSAPALVRVRWAGARPAAPVAAGGFQIQPKLYVLAVGVASYQHPAIGKLALPAKDARDFALALLRQKGRLYRDVEVRLLTDAQASADAIVDGLEWLQKQVTQHDVGVVFIAGHGLNDPVQGYTFLPVNADPERMRRTSVAMDEFRRTLAALPGKALFFFDTCHSGNVLGGTKARGAINDVSGVINELASAESGVVVFSSSTGRQLSYEDEKWGNGAFTKAVVEGLDGAADFQKNGRITHKMLDLYVSERVKQLTGGRQSPVTQAPGGVPDFPVAIVR